MKGLESCRKRQVRNLQKRGTRRWVFARQSDRTLVLYFPSYRTLIAELVFKATQSVAFVSELKRQSPVKKVTIYDNLIHNAMQ